MFATYLLTAVHQAPKRVQMICPECRADQVTILHNDVTCTNCGAVLSESFAEESRSGAHCNEQVQPLVTVVGKSTRAEVRFLTNIDRFAAVLGLTDCIHSIRQLYYDNKTSLSTFRSRFSDESAICLIYLATRSRRTGHTLAEYASRVGITDIKELNRAFKRYTKAIKMPSAQRIATATVSSQSSLSPSPSSPPAVDRQSDDSSERIITIIAKLYDPITTMFDLNDETGAALSYWTKEVYDIAERAGLRTGRPTGPFITACVVVAARAISARLVEVDWILLGQHISYAYTTIKIRCREIMNVLVHRAKSIPWLQNVVITRFNVHYFLCEIIQMDSSNISNDNANISQQESQPQPSLEYRPPSYQRSYKRIQRRALQIADATQYLNRPTTADDDLLSVEAEVRMIYFLLAKGVSAVEIEVMDTKHIYDLVRRLYIQDSRPALSQEDLNREEVSEKDMDDTEAAQYLQSDPSTAADTTM